MYVHINKQKVIIEGYRLLYTIINIVCNTYFDPLGFSGVPLFPDDCMISRSLLSVSSGFALAAAFFVTVSLEDEGVGLPAFAFFPELEGLAGFLPFVICKCKVEIKNSR